MENKRVQTKRKVEGSVAVSSHKNGENTESLILKLPEEILEMILHNVEDSKDIVSVSNTCPQFRRIVNPTVPTRCFGEIFSLIFPHLDKKEILRCRLVCKHWKKSTDNFLQTHPLNRPRVPYPYHPTRRDGNVENHPDHYLEYYPSLSSKNLVGPQFYTTHEMAEFHEQMDSIRENPIITRSAAFFNMAGHNDYDYWNCVFDFLSRFGHHIWHVSIGPECENSLLNYQVLRNAFALMPNLRSLCVYGFSLCHRNGYRQLQAYVQQCPLPYLDHLHTIEEIFHGELEPKIVVDEMIERYSNRLTTFTTRIWRLDPPLWNALTNVTSFEIVIVDHIFQSWKYFCRFTSAPNVARLTLSVNTIETVTISRMLKPLQNSFPALIYLNIQFSPRTRLVESSYTPRVRLDKVRTLEIKDHPGLKYGHIFSVFPRLEYMLVTHAGPINCYVDDEKEWKFRVCMRFQQMYGSCIWTRLESLKEFVLGRLGNSDDAENQLVTRRKYTRQM